MTTGSKIRDAVLARSRDDEAFRAELLGDPHTALEREFGIHLPNGINVHVHEDTTRDVHLVVPTKDRMSDEELAAISGGATWTEFGIRY